MKQFYLLVCGIFFFVNVSTAAIPNVYSKTYSNILSSQDEILESFKQVLSEVFGAGEYVIDAVDIEDRESGGKNVTASFSLFGKENVDLSGVYGANKRVESIEIEFSEESTIDFNKINQLLDGELKSTLPDGFPLEAGVWVKNLSVEFGSTGYLPSFLAATIGSPSEWELIDAGSFTASDVELSFEVENPKLATRTISGSISGTANAGDIPLTVSTTISNNSENNSISAQIENINLKNILDLIIGDDSDAFLSETPDLFKALNLSTVELAIFPGQKAINFNGASSLGSVIVDVNRQANNQKTLLALRPPDNFKFSDFAAILSPMDNLDMSGSYFIVTDKQSQIPAKFLDKTADNDAIFDVKKGVNLVTSIALPKQLEDMLGLNSIELVGSMPLDFTGVNLYAKLGIGLEIGDAFSFKELGAGLLLDKREIKLRLEGAGVFKTGSDQVEVFGGLILSALDQSLEFEVGLAADGRKAEKPASCIIPQAEWTDPFGIEGVGIRSLGIRGGVMIAFPWVASVGLDGNLRFGSVNDQTKHICGAVTAYVNIADVSESMLVAEVQNLTPLRFIEAFSEGANISGSLRDALDTGIESAKLKVVPREVELFGRTYSPGIALDSARLTLAGIKGLIGFSVGESGIKAYGQMDPFVIEEGGVTFFAIEGTQPNADGTASGPSVSLGLDAVDPHFKLDGKITVLEIEAETFIQVNKEGFEFEVTGNVLDGALSATAHIKAGELSPTSGLYAKVAFENRLQTMVANELISFIDEESKKSQEAYREAKSVLEQAKTNNDFEQFWVDAAKETVGAFAEMDKGLAIAGKYVVDGLLNEAINVRKISFEGEVTSMKAKVDVEVDMTIAGSDISETVSMELNISEDMFVDLIVDAIGDDVIDFFGTLDNEISDAFEDLGDELETAFADLGGYIEDGAIIVGEGIIDGAEIAGQGIIDGAEFVGNAFIDLGNAMTDFFEGSNYTPPVRNGTFSGIPPNMTHIQVTVNSFKVTDDEGGFYPGLDLFGGIGVNVSSNIKANIGATPHAYSVSARNRFEKSLNASVTVNHTKDFFISNTDFANQNGWIQIISLMSEWNTFDADREDLSGYANLNMYELVTNGYTSGSFRGFNGSGDDEAIQIYYTAKKIGSRGPIPNRQQMIAAVQSQNINEVRRLQGEGGSLRGNGFIEAAITSNNHYSMIQELLYAKNFPKTHHVELATQPNYYNPDIVRVLLSAGANASADALLNVVRKNDATLAYELLRYKAVPQLAHVQAAISNDNSDLVWALMRSANVQVTASELQYAVNKLDMNMVNLFVERGATSNAAMITQVVNSGNAQMLNQLLKVGDADHNALQAAANKNSYEMFKTIIDNRVSLVNNGPINTAIDYNNLEIVALGLRHGGSKNETLNYAVSKNNKQAMLLALERGATGTAALDYAVNTNDEAFFEQLVFSFSADPNQALSKAYSKNKINMGILALNAGAKASNQIAAAAATGQKDWVDLLLENKADPNLGMIGAVDNQHLIIVETLLNKGANAEKPGLIVSAATNKNFSLVKLLVEKGNANAENARTIAISNNDVNMVSFLLDNGAKPTGVNLPATNGWFEMVKLLVDRGANPNEGIASSIEKNHTNIAVYLLDAGANVVDYIKISAQLGNETMTAKLLEKGADPNDGTFNAVKYKHVNILEMLINAKADVSAPVLMDKAVSYFHEELIVLLLKHDGDIAYLKKNGDSYLHRVASKKGKDNLVKIFIDAGIEVDIRNKDGQTPLHLAVRSGKANVASVEALVVAGADVNAKTNKGKSILQRANNKAAKAIIEAAGGVK